jgi:alpha-galactosidase
VTIGARTTIGIVATCAAALLSPHVVLGQAHAPAPSARGPAVSSASLPGANREPPNAPATLSVEGGRFQLTYGGHVILAGRIGGEGVTSELRTLVDSAGSAITQVLKWTARGRGALALEATLAASDEAFACEVEPREDGLTLVRNSVGPSASLLNRAVYDRQGDWVLSVDFPAQVVVTPLASAVGDSARFRIEASGGEIALRFRPRYYQRHRGLPQFRPWTYRLRRESVAGWTSWFAFFDRVTEADIRRTADVLAEVLLPFGYRVLQIDDGYQRAPIGLPDHWLRWNDKFPSGLEGTRQYIAERGLTPGLWTNVAFHDRAWATAHPRNFLPSPEGGPAYGNWVGFVMDAASPATMDSLVLPVYRTLARSGWPYVKVDALRHLRYEGYNSLADVFRRRGQDRVAVYRSFAQAIRDALGPETFILGSWGPRPELAGILDACRMGDDGFGYGAFSQYNSFNNVVWRNDPDHIALTEPDAYRATTLTSLTGSLLMLTDPPEVYRTRRVEAAKRAAPVLFTVPGQLYDVDPSRSSRITAVDAEVSGAGPRPFEADQQLVQTLYLTEVNRPFERWAVLARTGGEAGSLRFADLGLPAGREYLVFEFWTKRLLGAFQEAFAPGPIDPAFAIQALCIRERVPHPQLVATNRHVGCGAADLVDVIWRGDTLSGTSEVVANDGYELYLTEPAGWRFVAASVDGAQPLGSERAGALRVVRMRAAQSGRVAWRVVWEREPGR